MRNRMVHLWNHSGVRMKAPRVLTAGPIVLAIGILHTLVGLLIGASPLADIFRAGYIGAVDGHFDRMAILWFLMFGFVLMLLGEAFRGMEQSPEGVPPRLGWLLGAICIAGAAAMPVSGFWLGLIPSVIVVRARRRPLGAEGAASA
jgi:hypothetical protein